MRKIREIGFLRTLGDKQKDHPFHDPTPTFHHFGTRFDVIIPKYRATKNRGIPPAAMNLSLHNFPPVDTCSS